MTGLLTNAQRSYPFDVRQFHRMMAAGIFHDQKVELVAGKIYPMTDLPPHTFAVGRMHESLRAVLPRDKWTIREEKPVLIGRYWAPSRTLRCCAEATRSTPAGTPDLATSPFWLRSPTRPITAIAGESGDRYAAAGIPTYMIVRLKGPDTLVEVWTGPTGRGRVARYADVVRYSARAAESVPTEVDGSEQGHVAVVDLIAG